MAIINVNLQDTFAQWRLATNAIGDYVGSTGALNTSATNLTSAINELRSAAVVNGIVYTSEQAFKIQVDNTDTYEFILDAAGNLSITGSLTAPVIGDVTGNVTGNLTGNVTGNVTGNLTGAVTGNATTATTLQTGRTISITGDATWTSGTFNGSTNVTAALTLANSGVTAGTYTKLTVDVKGRVTAGAALASGDITTALGFTPLSTTGKAADADLLDGYNSSLTTVASTIPVRDLNGDITTRRFIGTATAALFADLAEKYTTDQEYEPGTVIVVASSADGGCNLPESIASYAIGQRVLGVISENPAYLMNSESTGQAIALRGRVPVKVVGSIRKGQPLICNEDGKGIYGDTNNSFAIALETNEEPSVKLVECVIL